MTAQIISGTEIAKHIREELKQEVAELRANIAWYYSQALKIPGSDWSGPIAEAKAKIAELEKG